MVSAAPTDLECAIKKYVGRGLAPAVFSVIVVGGGGIPSPYGVIRWHGENVGATSGRPRAIRESPLRRNRGIVPGDCHGHKCPRNDSRN